MSVPVPVEATVDPGAGARYNGLDQLTRVDGLEAGSGTVEHAYGYDGFRVLTRGPDGATQYWFTPGVTERNGLREHYIRLGDRILPRVDQRPLEGGGSGEPAGGVVLDGRRAAQGFALALAALCLLLAIASLRRGRRLRWSGALASLLAGAIALPACSLFGFGKKPLWENAGVTYFHSGIGAGPILLTRSDGSVLEERRYEPFGEELDAYRDIETGGSEIGPVDFTTDSHNVLNKQTDPATGWSYHGARWMAPETARWLTPDPPVKAPKPKFMAEPWALHPYQYVQQNPIIYWDPWLGSRRTTCAWSASLANGAQGNRWRCG